MRPYAFVFSCSCTRLEVDGRKLRGQREYGGEEVDAASRVARNGVHSCFPRRVCAHSTSYICTLRAYMHYTRGAGRDSRYRVLDSALASLLSVLQYRKQCDFTAASAQAKCTPRLSSARVHSSGRPLKTARETRASHYRYARCSQSTVDGIFGGE